MEQNSADVSSINTSMNLVSILKLMRVKQWTKNLFVLAAWIFTKGWSVPEQNVRITVAFLVLCCLSSAVYVWNDIADVDADRKHPKKRNRPVASGAIGVGSAGVISAVLLAIGGAGTIWLTMNAGTGVALIIGAFLAIQLGYNLFAKKVAILDVFVISFGFVARAVFGAIALQVVISPWLLLCTLALALLIGFGKRRHEFMLTEGGKSETRASLQTYDRVFLDGLVWFAATLACVSFGLYTLLSKTAQIHPSLILTFPVVTYAVLRYVLLLQRGEDGDEPESLLFKDSHILVCFVLFLALSVAAMMGMEIPFLER